MSRVAVGTIKLGIILVLAMAMALFLLGGAAVAFVTPHGPYIQNPEACATCHNSHAARGINLVVQPTTTGVCYTCHDGTGSIYNVQSNFSAGGGNSVYHPVKDTGNPGISGAIECSDCHNPHGDADPGNPGHVYPRLLRASDGTDRYYQGPAYCNACHGATDRNFTGPADTYWEDTLGNHVNNNSAAHYNSNNTALQPSSGTLVTCVLCHDRHASPNQRLLLGVEESLCQGCHLNGKGHSTARFNKTGSVHNLDGAGGSKLECSSCHGPHTISSAATVGCSQCHYPTPTNFNQYLVQGATSVLAEPDNTKKAFAGQAGTGLGGIANSVGDLSDFCLRCHDGSPPTAASSTSAFVPYSIVFPSTSFTTNSGGWNKNGYKSNGHATSSSAIKCGECHESHGSDYPALQRYAEDTSTTSGECLRCHDGSVTGAANVKTDLTKAKNHPALTVSGKHSDTENYNNLPLANRHAECADCHDPHQNTSATATAPNKRGSIAGVSGVSVNFGTSSWTSWPGDATFSLKLGIDYQYELCFKCHSYYSYGTSPPAAPSGGTETDQAKEFNPNNPAYHAVVGTSKVATFTYNSQIYYYGKYVAPWTATSRLYCTDCHATDSSGVKGPHGSINPYILVAPWNPNTGAEGRSGTGTGSTSGDLCFKCHDWNFYAGGTSGTVTVRSKFSKSGDYNLHKRHSGRGCASCHGAVPHGWPQRTDPSDNVTTNGAVAEWNLGDPYWTGSWLDVNTWRAPGAWSQNDCTHGRLPAGGNPNSGSACG